MLEIMRGVRIGIPMESRIKVPAKLALSFGMPLCNEIWAKLKRQKALWPSNRIRSNMQVACNTLHSAPLWWLTMSANKHRSCRFLFQASYTVSQDVWTLAMGGVKSHSNHCRIAKSHTSSILREAMCCCHTPHHAPVPLNPLTDGAAARKSAESLSTVVRTPGNLGRYPFDESIEH